MLGLASRDCSLLWEVVNDRIIWLSGVARPRCGIHGLSLQKALLGVLPIHFCDVRGVVQSIFLSLHLSDWHARELLALIECTWGSSVLLSAYISRAIS